MILPLTNWVMMQTRFGIAAVSWAYNIATKQLHTNVTVPVGSTAEVVHEKEMPAVAAMNADSSSLHEGKYFTGKQLVQSFALLVTKPTVHLFRLN